MSDAAPPEAVPTTADPNPAEPPAQPIPASSGRRPRDMAISLLVLLVPILIAVLVYRGFFDGDKPNTLDRNYVEEVLGSAQRAGIAPLPSSTAPDGWTIMSIQVREGVLRIGYIGPGSAAVQLVEGAVAKVDPALVKPEESQVTREINGVRVIVFGRADQSQLEQLLPQAFR